MNNKDRIAATMYPLGTWFVSRIYVWIPCIKETIMMMTMMMMMIMIIIIITTVNLPSFNANAILTTMFTVAHGGPQFLVFREK